MMANVQVVPHAPPNSFSNYPQPRKMEEDEQKKQRKKRRYRPGTKALREIRNYQKTTHLLIPKQPFQRLVKEIAQGIRGDFRFTPQSIAALQTAAEEHLRQVFDDTNLCCLHGRRVTIQPRDMKLATRIRGDQP